MEPLSHPDSIYLSAAQGWLELGNSTEAAVELDRINSSLHEHPEVLHIRWQLAAKHGRWAEALCISEACCRLEPGSPFGWIHRSYSLHELKQTQEAWDALFPKVESFPEEWLIRYNLACYACQLGRVEEAKVWLRRALELGNTAEIKKMAAGDPDLRRLFRAPE